MSNESPTVSIIVCGRNVASTLPATLAAIGTLDVPEGWDVELIVVDNGSIDDTAAVIDSAPIENMPVRRVYEPRPGASNARNTGVTASKGEVLVFTDSDCRPPSYWLPGMCGPILFHGASAVAGGVTIAPHLLRPWMTKRHRSWLASSEWLDQNEPQSMVGANMALSRSVFDRIPGFDPELGPGGIGYGEEDLLVNQLETLGDYVTPRFDIVVEHHFLPDRLSKRAFRWAAKKMGQSMAYIRYHWTHEIQLWSGAPDGDPTDALNDMLTEYWSLKRRAPLPDASECVPEDELHALMQIHYYATYRKLEGRKRKYDWRGLTKLMP